MDQVQRFLRHPKIEWMGATLDGMVPAQKAVFEAKFMLPWSFSEEGAADKHMAQLQHNMLVSGTRRAYLSILTGGAKWILIEVEADPLYQTVLLQVERLFWRCVQTGEVPRPSMSSRRRKAAAPPHRRHGRLERLGGNAAVFIRTRDAHAAHEIARAELKALVPGTLRRPSARRPRQALEGRRRQFDVIANGGEHAHLQ